MKNKKEEYAPQGSTISIAHTALEDAMPDSRLMLRKDVEKVLLKAKGFTFGTGNTVDDLIAELYAKKFIDINGKWVYIEKW